MSAPLVEVEHLRTVVGGSSGLVHAVDDVSFTIAAGETFVLLGESGCGKSMTALSIMRLLPDGGQIKEGTVRFEGQDVLGLTEANMRNVRGGAMAMIFQEPATSLNPVLTVGQQIGEVLSRHFGLSRHEARQRAAELLVHVGIANQEQRLDEYPFQFSGGMNQRVMIAMALAGSPRLLIADEPTTALDVTTQAQVLDLMASLQARANMAMLLITHDLGIVGRLAHWVGVMYAGELVEVAPRGAFFSTPRHPYTRKLFAALPSATQRHGKLETIVGNVPSLTKIFTACRFADRCPNVWDLCRTKPPAWHRVASGHEVRCHLYDASLRWEIAQAQPREADPVEAPLVVDAGPLLTVKDLRVYFPIRQGVLKRVVGHVKAVDGVSLDIAPGRTLALVGESGCGKTTAGKAILQLIQPTAGSIRFRGTELTGMSDRKLRPLRRAMQIVFQNPFASLDPRMRVGEIIEEGVIALNIAETKHAQAERIGTLLKRVGLTEDTLGRYPHEFSGGQRQRIAIARALAVEPQLVICDEPTSALDVSVQAQILNLLKELQRSLGLSYLFITHNMAVVEYLADEVAVMYLGRIVEQGSADEVLRTPRHPYTEALLAAVPRVESGGPPATLLSGDLSSRTSPPSGCPFHPRCPKAMDICRKTFPARTQLSERHGVDCHLYNA